MKELQSQWQEFSGSLCGAEDVLQSVQDTFHTATLLVDTNAELVEQLDLLRVSLTFDYVFKGLLEHF